jgi:hypothetical protein
MHAGDVYMVMSSNNGQTWSPKKPVLQSNGLSRGFFDVKTLPDGEVGAIWLEGKAPDDTMSIGSTIKFAKTDGLKGFAKETTISQNVCQCCKTKLYADSRKGIHVVFRKIFADGSRDIAHAYSANNGRTFSSARNISPDKWKINGCPHVGPDMVSAGHSLHFVWFTMGGKGGIHTTASANNGQTFSLAGAITQTKASHPQITGLPDGTLAIVWDESCEKDGKVGKKIGLQIVTHAGPAQTTYLAQESNLTHSVIAAADKESLFVAYTRKTESGKKIAFQTVRLK